MNIFRGSLGIFEISYDIDPRDVLCHCHAYEQKLVKDVGKDEF